MLILTVAWILILLSILIVIHEFGHFLAAKLLGVHVEEFALGFPPRIKKLFTWWNTPFVLNSIPIGGYVRLFGDDSETLEQLNEVKQEDSVGENQAFRNKPIWARLIILLAGVAVNFVFGIICFTLIYSFTGIPKFESRPVTITNISPDSPAAAAQLQPNDVIVALGDQADALVTADSTQTVIQTISSIPDSDMILRLQRDGVEQELTVGLREPQDSGRLGVGLNDGVYVPIFYPWYEMPFRASAVGIQDSLALSGMILQSLGTMVGNLAQRGQVPSDLKGVIGIVDETYQSGMLESGWTGSANWLGLISINLAIMNLLPLPVLDGGRALFLLSEPFIGRNRRLRWEQRVNGIGMIVLLGLFVIISVSDVISILK